jgi:hypothetical protein
MTTTPNLVMVRPGTIRPDRINRPAPPGGNAGHHDHDRRAANDWRLTADCYNRSVIATGQKGH